MTFGSDNMMDSHASNIAGKGTIKHTAGLTKK